MATGLTSHASILINAPISEVWKALTTPEIIKQWFFGVETISTWQVDASIVHKGEWQGKPYEDKGRILKIEPERLLVHTHWSVGGLPDSPENYQQVTYSLSEKDGETEVTIDEQNLPSEEAKQQSDKAWKMVLDNLKTLLQ